MTETFHHALFAAIVAPVIGIAMAALLDWLRHPFKEPDAIVREIRHCLVEGVIGGGLEGYLVVLIIAGIKVLE
ncbi:MAG: hypothetical protein JO093_01275 [Acidobacteria bacterium]|nr:hypothetical protein [Acidobacteriota bacterium]MBV9068990.1 hypothetical protein [Acidobacteriota bacterium]MBV9184214.1 hypothetical protein [Acidobacteriota bacterium]